MLNLFRKPGYIHNLVQFPFKGTRRCHGWRDGNAMRQCLEFPFQRTGLHMFLRELFALQVEQQKRIYLKYQVNITPCGWQCTSTHMLSNLSWEAFLVLFVLLLAGSFHIQGEVFWHQICQDMPKNLEGYSTIDKLSGPNQMFLGAL